MDTIRMLMVKERVTQEDMARTLGCSQANVSQMLNRNTMRISKAKKMLESMGYELVARKGDKEYRF